MFLPECLITNSTLNSEYRLQIYVLNLKLDIPIKRRSRKLFMIAGANLSSAFKVTT
jgi:hypothetical protein